MVMWKALEGYKTYIVVTVFLLCVVAEKFIGWDIPGFVVGDDWFAYVLNALGLGALRAGIAGK